MPAGHKGWCDKRCGSSAVAGKALRDAPDDSDEDEPVATEPVADVVARVQAAARERRPPLPLEPVDPRADTELFRQLFGFLKLRSDTLRDLWTASVVQAQGDEPPSDSPGGAIDEQGLQAAWRPAVRLASRRVGRVDARGRALL